jgi:DNA modification methylase
LDYKTFLAEKALTVKSAGFTVDTNDINQTLFPFQRDLVRWSLRKGRSALFADTGLGKTFMQLEWARLAANRTLILAPLAVARQTVLEGAKLGLTVTYARSQSQAAPDGITITNYEMLSHFDPDYFGAIVLDESSILKSFEGKTRTVLIKAFEQTPMRLCCTATPAPNDISEIANHAEFLGVMKREEMLAAFFVHDDDGWRLKGHARRGPFFQWLASWAMSIRKPSNLGYSDEGYILPGLDITPVLVQSNYVPAGKLFHDKLQGVTERAEVRRATLAERVKKAAELINSEPGKQWLVWCGLNDEGREIAKLLSGAVLIEGSNTPDEKADALTRFAAGETKIVITKVSIAGFGLNFQRCSRMVFVGLGDSYEDYYQAIRRCYRFGQIEKVQVHIVLSDIEETIYQNVIRKEKEAAVMADELVNQVASFEKNELGKSGADSKLVYSTKEVTGQGWKLMLGDSSERLKELADNSIDLSVFSPPFGSLYTYSASERDLGNCKNGTEFWQHFSFISQELLRVIKPGRNICVHVAQIPTQKAKDGVIGLSDFRGETIRHFTESGFIYHGEVCIDKDPQAQAIRTKSKALLFTQFHKDSSWSRPALADYILLFRKPGDNQIPIHPDVTNNEWIEFARPIWYGIKEGDTLNVVEARSADDERHICPLQLGTIERCIRLWSNPGETVLTPFLGIGSEVYQAVKFGRKGVGVELNPTYFKVAVKNVREAERLSQQEDLFSISGIAI